MHSHIYPSTKTLPYVYYGVHKISGHFYYGVRYGEKSYLYYNRPSNIDFGTYYFTSSIEIKELGFENFDWIILAEFFNEKFAREFEDECIKENWKHPLSLNFNNRGEKFNTSGIDIFNKKSEEEKEKTREKLSIAGKKAHKNRTLENKEETALKKRGRKCYFDENENHYYLFPNDEKINLLNLKEGRKSYNLISKRKGKKKFHDKNNKEFLLNENDEIIIKLQLTKGISPLSKLNQKGKKWYYNNDESYILEDNDPKIQSLNLMRGRKPHVS